MEAACAGARIWRFSGKDSTGAQKMTREERSDR